MLKMKKLDYISVIKYLILFIGFLLFSKLDGSVMPYSTALLAVALSSGYSLIISPILYVCPFFILGKLELLLPTASAALILTAVVFIYKRFKLLPSYEIAFYTLASLSVFVFLDGYNVSFEKKALSTLFTGLFTFLLHVSFKSATEKGFKYKLSPEEIAAICVVIITVGLGFCNLLIPEIWKAVAVFSLLILCYTYNSGGVVYSAVLGTPFAIYYGNVSYVSVFLIYGLISLSTINFSRYLSALLVILSDLFIEIVFKFYRVDFIYVLPSFIGAILFSAIPLKTLDVIKDKLSLFKEKQLVKSSINRNRIYTSNRLYELSGVFSDMSLAFNSFKKKGLSEEKAKKIILSELKTSACFECDGKDKCNLYAAQIDLKKMIDIGFAKGKLSLIDFPESLTEKCYKPNNLLYGLNKLLADYRNYHLTQENMNNGRELISKEAEGVSEMLRSLAFESGTLLKYQGKLEKKLSEELLKNGYAVNEILIYGENETLSVSLILNMKEFNLTQLLFIIKNVVGVFMLLSDKNNITEEKCYLLFKVAAKYDAVFGLSSAVKDGSNKSGDTHSVIRLKEDKFLVALSDGMGSGEKAENLSSISLSLIESFYRAGLKSELILNTVNRLLSFNEEDDFTALDIFVVDLKRGQTDFIKYGAPYGFIITEEGIKIVEGNSLPLGILTELKPSVCSTGISDGDMILIVTDGISDAFKDSTAIIDYLRTLPAKNPQTLTDSVLNKARELNGGKNQDDMTALAVRIFKPN